LRSARGGRMTETPVVRDFLAAHLPGINDEKQENTDE
jgi:hypothetical protein